jgi:hypothetical protein
MRVPSYPIWVYRYGSWQHLNTEEVLHCVFALWLSVLSKEGQTALRPSVSLLLDPGGSKKMKWTFDARTNNMLVQERWSCHEMGLCSYVCMCDMCGTGVASSSRYRVIGAW